MITNLRVTFRRQVSRDEWNSALLALGGSYFHCHCQALYDASASRFPPVFLEAFDIRERVGMATATLWISRLPLLSRYCRTASFSSLPAVRPNGVSLEQAVLNAFESKLRTFGVFRIQVQSRFSRNSVGVLAPLGYCTSPRYEFYLPLSNDLKTNWSALRHNRRNAIRNALKSGLDVVRQSNRLGVAILLKLHCEALVRRGIFISNCDQQIDPILNYLIETSRADVLVCYRDNVPLGALMFGIFESHACTLLSGSSCEGNKSGANVLLRWKMIELLTERCVELVNLGGVALQPGESVKTNGLFAFKKEFGADPVAQPSGEKTFPGLGQTLSRALDWWRSRRTKPRQTRRRLLEPEIRQI